MKKELIALFFIFLISLPFVIAVSYPHAFKGNIFISDGKNPNGLTLIAKLDGVATGSCIIKEGKYDLTLIDPIGDKGKIKFYIGNEIASETYSFSPFNITNLDLHFDSVDSIASSCGDNICSIGECAVCPVDCNIQECKNDGSCDLEIGEDCITSPEDCGMCCGDGVCNNGEACSSCSTDCGACTSTAPAGGGGGGGGGGSSGSTSVSVSQNVEPNPEDGIISTKDLNKEKETSNQQGLFNFLTGFVTGAGEFAGSTLGIVVIIFVVLVVGLFVALRFLKIKKPKKK